MGWRLSRREGRLLPAIAELLERQVSSVETGADGGAPICWVYHNAGSGGLRVCWGSCRTAPHSILPLLVQAPALLRASVLP